MRFITRSLTLRLCTFLCTICITGIFTTAIAGNNAGAAFNYWPDTGQTKCYNNSNEIDCPAPGQRFYGQDAQYKGYRSYTKLGYNGAELPGNATIEDGWIMTRDNITGLIWEIKTDDGSIHDQDNTFTWCDTNPETNGGDQGTCSDPSAENDTEAFIAKLNQDNFGGFSDWRMPTVKELSTLINLGAENNAPAVDPDFFPDTISDNYWSATTVTYDSSAAWYVCFSDRCVDDNMYKDGWYPVRAVRGGQPVPESRFIDNGDGTITDVSTSLMWQKCYMGQNYNITTGECEDIPEEWGTYSWEEALEYCETSSLAGNNDWRLPSRNEMQSLADYSKTNPAMSELFSIPSWYDPNDPFNYILFWTSSTIFSLDPNNNVNYANAFYVGLYEGEVCSYDKLDTTYLIVRAVRTIEADGDHDFDHDVDGSDLANLTFYAQNGHGYDPNYDLSDQKGKIDSLDIKQFAGLFGHNESDLPGQQ